MTTTQCLKVASLRKETGDLHINLEKWMSNPKNVYVGRPGRVFIGTGEDKKVFHYPGSKFANPFKLSDGYSLEESLMLYEEHLKETGLLDQLQELRGKNLGCFCDQTRGCHAKVLVRLLNNI